MSVAPEISKKKKLSSKKQSSPRLNINREEINDRLTAIYQGPNGSIPDMKKMDIKKTNLLLKTLVIILFFGTILSTVAWINFFFAPASKNASEKYLLLNFNGPSSVGFGELSTYTIQFKNISSAVLKKSVLNLRYPPGFVFVSSSLPTKNNGHNEIELGDISSFTEKTITITGLLYGSTKQEKMWRISLNFQPDNLNSPLLRTITFNNFVSEAPFKLSLTAPEKIPFQQEINYVFTISPKTTPLFFRLELLPIIPDGFQITSSSPTLTTKDRWIITSFPSSTKELTFQLKGLFKNSTDDNSLKGQLFFIPTSNNTARFQIAEVYNNFQLPTDQFAATSTSLIALAINGQTNHLESSPGNTLVFNLLLKNNTKEIIRDTSIKLSLDSPAYNKQSVLNWSKIQDKYDGDIHGEQLNSALRHGQIVWNKKKIAALAELKPDQEVAIEVILPIKDNKKINLAALTEHTITALAEVTYQTSEAEKTISTTPLIITLNSDLELEIKKSSNLNNTTEKEFLMTFVLTNTYHPLKNVQISAELSNNLEPTSESFSTPAGEASYSKKTKKLIWTIPEIPESIDVLAWEFSLIQTSVASTKLSTITLEAEDLITGKKISLQKDPFSL